MIAKADFLMTIITYCYIIVQIASLSIELITVSFILEHNKRSVESMQI